MRDKLGRALKNIGDIEMLRIGHQDDPSPTEAPVEGAGHSLIANIDQNSIPKDRNGTIVLGPNTRPSTR